MRPASGPSVSKVCLALAMARMMPCIAGVSIIWDRAPTKNKDFFLKLFQTRLGDLFQEAAANCQSCDDISTSTKRFSWRENF